MFWSTVKWVSAALAAAAVVVSGAGVHRSMAQERAAGPEANKDTPSVTVLMTRRWSPDGKVPTGTGRLRDCSNIAALMSF